MYGTPRRPVSCRARVVRVEPYRRTHRETTTTIFTTHKTMTNRVRPIVLPCLSLIPPHPPPTEPEKTIRNPSTAVGFVMRQTTSLTAHRDNHIVAGFYLPYTVRIATLPRYGVNYQPMISVPVVYLICLRIVLSILLLCVCP